MTPRNATDRSYTAKMFANHRLLSDKLLEEAQELAEAVQGKAEGKDSVQHVVEEVSEEHVYVYGRERDGTD